MRRIVLTLGLVAVAGTLSCGTDREDPSAPEGAVLLPAFVQGGHPAHGAKNFNAPSLSHDAPSTSLYSCACDEYIGAQLSPVATTS